MTQKPLRTIVESGGNVGSWTTAKQLRSLHPGLKAVADHLAAGRIGPAGREFKKIFSKSVLSLGGTDDVYKKAHDVVHQNLDKNDDDLFMHTYLGGHDNAQRVSTYPHLSEFLRGQNLDYHVDRRFVDPGADHNEHTHFDHELSKIPFSKLKALGKAHHNAIERGLQHLNDEEEKVFNATGKHPRDSFERFFKPFMRQEEQKLGLPAGISDFTGKNEYYNI